MLDILEIIKNVNTIYTTNSNLSVLKDFERVLDELDLYVYKNWEDGELVSGPHVDRHWITASFMWPKDKMPDPMGGKRLLDYGCTVNYEKTFLVEPRKIESPDDFRPGTKKAKLDRHPVWVVNITMPRKLASDMFNGYMSKMKENMGIGRTEGAAVPAPKETADTMQPAGQPAAGVPAGGAVPETGGMPNV
jgi:hypothetical protein